MLFLFLLGQGVWIYHVRELKVKEFKMRAGYLLSEVAEEYIADEGLKYLAYGRDSSFRNGRLRENKDEKCFPVNHFYVFSEDKIHLVYDGHCFLTNIPKSGERSPRYLRMGEWVYRKSGVLVTAGKVEFYSYA